MNTHYFELAKKEISKTIELGRKDLTLTRDMTRALVGNRKFEDAFEYIASVRKIVGHSAELAAAGHDADAAAVFADAQARTPESALVACNARAIRRGAGEL